MKATQVSLIAALACIAAIALLTTSTPQTPRERYEQWKTEYGHLYRISKEQDAFRFKIFEANLREIEEHNAKEDKTYTVGVNQFTGYTKEELKEMYLSSFQPNTEYKPTDVDTSVKLNVDWITYGAVSPVKAEGQCKANYAFSTVGGIEGVSVIVYHQQTEYSAQEIVDCSQSFGNNGCIGGNMANSYSFIRARGINTQQAYPYQGRIQQCATTSGFFRITGYSSITSCFSLDSALTGRPISVALDGNNFFNYQSGIFSNCGTNLSLAGLLAAGTDQWYKVKLSWGTSWGESGYIRILRGNNVCGICLAASYPLTN